MPKIEIFLIAILAWLGTTHVLASDLKVVYKKHEIMVCGDIPAYQYKRVEIKRDTESIQINNVHNDGALELVAPNGVSCNLEVTVENIDGVGMFSAKLDQAKSFEFTNVHCRVLELEFKQIGKIICKSGNNVGTFKVEVQKCDRISLGSNFKADQVSLYIAKHANRIACNGLFADTVRIFGNGPGETCIKKCTLVLSGPKNAQDYSDKSSPDVRVEEFMCDELEVIGQNVPLKDRGAALASVTLETIDIRKTGVICDLEGLPLNGLTIRDLCFLRPNASLKIANSLPQSGYTGSEFLVVTGVNGVTFVNIRLNTPTKKLIVKDISCGSVEVELGHWNSDKIFGVDLGGIVVRHGINAPRDPLLYLAKVNNPTRPFDRADFFEMIANHAFFRKPNGTIGNLRFPAMKEKRMAEISQRTPWPKIIGYVVYVFTGFGYTIWPPLIISSMLVIGFAIAYFGVLMWFRSSAEMIGGYHFIFAFLFSCVATFSLGTGLEIWLIRYWRNRGLPLTIRKSHLLLSAVVRIQGFLFFIQVTLIGIFFGETSFFGW